MRRLARAHDLVETGGSDFHGGEQPEIVLGRGRGRLRLGRRFYDAIQARLAERRRAAVHLTPPKPTGNLARPG